jgi:Protein of unknown function (DUF3987)
MTSTENNNNSAQTERQQVINWLVAHNYPALPVAPKQDAKKYHKEIKPNSAQNTGRHCPVTETLQPIPLFTGKNPSYLDQAGIPHLVNHRQYQKQLPTRFELEQWFANPSNGIGTLGGWNDTIWLDFDVKKFDSEEDCTLAAIEILEQESLNNAFLEVTHSGGWRIGVKVEQKPDFTNFALTSGGTHLGEALGEGRFTVLAPTIGPSGNPYKSIHRGQPPLIESLSSIGIYSTKTQTPQKTSPRFVSPTVAIPGSIPLEKLGNNNSREILNGANPTGDRSEALATAIQEWYGWTNWAINNNISITGDTATLSHHAGALLGIDSNRIKRILKTVDQTNCHPAALHRGSEESCWKKIYRIDKATFESKCPAHVKDSIKREWKHNNKNYVIYQNSPEIDTLNNSEAKSIQREPSLRDYILEILAQEQTQSEQKEAFIKLAHNTGNSLRSIEQLAEVIASEIDFGMDTAAASQNIKNLLSTRKTKLNLERYLEPWFAKQLVATAKAMPTAPEFLFTTLLAAAASRIGTAAKVVIKPSGQYTQPMVIWSAIVADSGAMKTPSQRVIIEPLIAQETEAAEEYNNQLDQYKAETERRQYQKKADLEESVLLTKPIRKRYITKDITLETLQRIHGENPRGLLYYRDELVGMHKTRNVYRGGVGADEEAELDQHNGSAIIYDRGDKSVCLAHSAVSRTGSIQWEVLANIMGDHGDFNGQFARWLFCAAKAPKRYLNLTAEATDLELGLSQALEQLYGNLGKLGERDYLLSFDAKQLFELWQHKLVDAQCNEPEGSGISLVYPKIEGYTARLALWLHIVNATLRGESPNQVINAQTMELAIELAAYFLWQQKLIHSRNSPDAGAVPLLMKVHSFATRLGQATASALKSGIRALKKMTTAQIRELMKAAAQSGMGQIQGEENQLVYIPESIVKGVNFDKKLAEVSTAQTQAYTGIEARLDEIDTWTNSLENNLTNSTESNPGISSRQFVNELPSTPFSEDFDAVGTDRQFECQLTDDWQPGEIEETDAIVSSTFTDSALSTSGNTSAQTDNLYPGGTPPDEAISNQEVLSNLDDDPDDTPPDVGTLPPSLSNPTDDTGKLYNVEFPSTQSLLDTDQNSIVSPDRLEDGEKSSGNEATSLGLDSQNPQLNTNSDEISPQAGMADAAIPDLTQANSTAIKEVVQLTIDGKVEPIECILPQQKKLVGEPAMESVKEPLHDFHPGQEVISLATHKKGFVSSLHELDLVMVRFEDNPEFDCPCNYKRLKRLNRLN